MTDQNKTVVTLTLSLLGAINLILASLGLHIMSNGFINGIATLASVLFVVGGIIYNHFKHTPTVTTKTVTSTPVSTVPTTVVTAPLSDTPKATAAP